MKPKYIFACIFIASQVAIAGLCAAPQSNQQPAQENGSGQQQTNGDRITATTTSVDAGIKLSIVDVSSEVADAIKLRLAFENANEEDAMLNLGIMLGNGKFQLPTQIRLTLTDESGKSRVLHFSDKRFGGIAGRVDDYFLPLRAGSTYSLTLNMSNFWCPKSKEPSIGFSPQEYKIRASFAGQGARNLNADTEGLQHMPFFVGKVRSEVMPFRVGKKG